MMAAEIGTLTKRIRWLLCLFVAGLVLSGLTAFPIRAEAEMLHRLIGEGSSLERVWPQMSAWISFVHTGVSEVGRQYPFLFYGTDWLAFAHIVIAIAFIGPLRDPVRNIWVVHFGMIACILVVPCALICGHIRGVPFFWRLIDCGFGLIGAIPLCFAERDIRRLIRLQERQSSESALNQ